MGLIQENFMSISSPGDAKADIAACRAVGIGERLIHSVEDLINIGATRETNKAIININEKYNSLTALGRIVCAGFGVVFSKTEL